MATINRENIGVLNDRLTVTVKEDDYNPGFKKALKQYSQNANIPGFRKGKIPTGLIKKMYGGELFPQEVLKAVEDGLNDYLKKEELDLFGQPIIIPDEKSPKVDFHNPKDYSFDFEIGLKPKLDLNALEKEFKFSQYKVKPEEKEIDEQIEQLQKRAAKREEIEKAEEQDHLITLSFDLADENGKEIGEKEEDDHQDTFRLDYFSKRFQNQLTTKGKGDYFSTQLKNAFKKKELEWITDDWKLDKETAPENHYVVTVQKIEKSITRELDEEFFQEVYPGGEVKTEEDFRKKITEDFQAQWDHQTKHMLEHEIFEKLINETKIELPVEYLKKQLQRENGKLKTEEEVEKEYPEFEKQTKWGLITSQIIQKEELDAKPEEIKDFFRQQIQGYFQMPTITDENQQMIDELTERLMQEEGRIDEAYRTIITNKLFDWIIEKADIEEKEISSDEFKKLNEEHNHQHHGH